MAPPGELRVNAGVVLLAGKTVWSTPERLEARRYTNPPPLPLLMYCVNTTVFIIMQLQMRCSLQTVSAKKLYHQTTDFYP